MRDDPRPNVLWICTDSQRFDTLGCYGNPYVRTPNIDRLAENGMLFEHCYSQNPLCTPSRGAFLTGRYPVTMGLRQNGQNINPEEKLVTRLLADQDYLCGLSGKLHVHACDRRHTLGDEWWELPAEEQVIQGVEPRIDDGYAEFYWDHAPSPIFRSSAYHRWVRDHGARICAIKRDDAQEVFNGMPEALHQTTFCAEKAIGFIEGYQDYAHPWLFSVNIFDPHFSVDPPEAYLQRYLDHLDDIPLPNYQPGELDGKPDWQRARHRTGYNARGGYDLTDTGDAHEHRMLRAGYWAMCDLIDVQVGRMLDALQRTGQRDNTLVIFTSDHGEMLGDHGFYIKGPFLYDEAIHVPLIVSWPGHIPQGVRSQALVELSDLAPTLLDAAGAPRYPGMQTKSLWPLLSGQSNPQCHRDDIYSEYYNTDHDNPMMYLTMVQTRDYKLIVDHTAGRGELYDLRQDPTETWNHWDDADFADIKTNLLLRLCARMAFTADPLPERVGIY